MKLFIGRIVWRQEETQHVRSMLQLYRYLDARHIDFTDGTVPGDALVSRSRSIVASAFLRSDADVLVTIDTDIVFRPEDVVTMAEKAGRYGMIGAVYMTRNIATQPALMLPESPVTFGPGREPVEAPYISTGFTATHRRVFERLAKDLPLCHRGWNDRGIDTSFYPFYLPMVVPNDSEGHWYLSEDWAFCERAKQAGFSCWIDPSIRLGHIGSYQYHLEDLVRPERIEPTPLRLTRADDGTLSTDVLTQPVLATATTASGRND